MIAFPPETWDAVGALSRAYYSSPSFGAIIYVGSFAAEKGLTAA
jgi:hypothetical protein